MGLEAKCIASYKGQSGEGTALLESDGILYRGAFRLFIPAAALKGAKARNGAIVVTLAGEVAILELGSIAEKWLDRIANPKTLIDKLAVKSGSNVSVIGQFDAGFKEQLKATAAKIAFGTLQPASDTIFFAAESKDDLRQLTKAKSALAERGAIWIIYPKGVDHIKERDVTAITKKAGLVANKVVSFSPSHTGLRFVPAGRG